MTIINLLMRCSVEKCEQKILSFFFKSQHKQPTKYNAFFASHYFCIEVGLIELFEKTKEK
jgi:hypothetical protein